MKRVKITIRISRYQRDKQIANRWRVEGDGETYTKFRARILKESKK